eukprot:TRINITY_DN54_c0_g1_i8.p3 TRINITY_DN54_c0_g1~~TRINITY_DN54_c0_g1_i8.p3  ORF type:complete len:124 (+),score=46.67 TRINITY_DN54_c0_g1_i8:64-435(+)
MWLYGELALIEGLGLGVGEGVVDEGQESLAGIDGPPADVGSPALGLSVTAETASEAEERNSLLVGHDVLEVATSLLELHAADGIGSFVGVLEVNTDVGAAGPDGFFGVLGLARINLHHSGSTE